MSQRNRIAVAAVALTAALSLAAPPPTHAAGLQSAKIPGIAAWDRAWHWLANLLPAGLAPKPADRLEKEGSAINPDGHTGTAPAPSTAQGSMIDPDGSW